MRQRLVFILAAGLTMACGGTTDINEPLPTTPRHADATVVAGGVVSQPIAVTPSVTGAGLRTGSLVTQSAYVSLRPGTVANGTTATITDLRTGTTRTTPVVEGGFDPLAIPAAAGDTIEVSVQRADTNAVTGYFVVRANTPPIIVRTNPPKGQTDVPVNTNVVVVFSTPISAASINASTITLRADGVTVDGIAQQQSASTFTVEFVPERPLALSTAYVLSVDGGVTDVSGSPLGASETFAFVTAGPPDTSPLVFASISVSSAPCGLTPAGKAYCWGLNSSGQAGDGTFTNRSGAVAVSGGLTFMAISTSGGHACALTASGAAYCWGNNAAGQLGDGTFASRAIPAPVQTALRFASLSATGPATCGVTSSGDAYCWGTHKMGMLGAGTMPCPIDGCAMPSKVLGGLTFRSVSVGGYTTCGLTATGVAYCWGQNGFGEIGSGSATGPEVCAAFYVWTDGTPCSRVPVGVASSVAFTTLTSGGFFACGLAADGLGYCWGANNTGELGDGTRTATTAHPFPSVAAGGMRFRELVPGNQRACGIALTGETYCWGAHGAGENDLPECTAGNGGCQSTAPVLVKGGRSFTTVSVGTGNACGLTAAGTLYCWGANVYGVLGNNSATNSSTPVAVLRNQ